MPLTLKFLCLALAALLVADIALLATDLLGVSESDPSARNVIVGVNIAAIAIASLLLALLFAFAKRVRKSRTWLQAFVLVNAVVLIAGSSMFDLPLQGRSPREVFEIVRPWSEALVCVTLAFVLRSHESKTWFARGAL